MLVIGYKYLSASLNILKKIIASLKKKENQQKFCRNETRLVPLGAFGMAWSSLFLYSFFKRKENQQKHCKNTKRLVPLSAFGMEQIGFNYVLVNFGVYANKT